jgi:D-alanyl-D-alanine carboxypeptidase/D-alanyl-D-alanine-endopeptidase (penicillin-binding protein 4)
LATTGKDLPGTGKVHAKTGTVVGQKDDGGIEIQARNLAGYIETRSGRLVAYALMVNHVGEVESLEEDLGAVIAAEATISSLPYESL